MLDNLKIHIDELRCDYFDDCIGMYLVDAWWREGDDNDNREYCVDEPFERGATIGNISKDGETFVWSDSSFRDAICDESNDNDWVIEDIEDTQARIRGEFLSA